MKKIVVLAISVCIAFGVAFALPVDKAAAKTIELKLSHVFPPVQIVHAKVLVPWAEEVAKLSNGELKISIFPGGALGKPGDQYDLAEKGIADIIYILQDYTPGRFPLTEVFELPFMIRTANAVVEAGYRLQYHFDTNWTPMLEYFKELPAKSGFYHMDERTDIFQAKKILGDHLCLFGNLKPSLFTLGTEEEVERQVKAIIDGCAGSGGLIVSAELTADSRFELVDKMIQVTKTYGVY